MSYGRQQGAGQFGGPQGGGFGGPQQQFGGPAPGGPSGFPAPLAPSAGGGAPAPSAAEPDADDPYSGFGSVNTAVLNTATGRGPANFAQPAAGAAAGAGAFSASDQARQRTVQRGRQSVVMGTASRAVAQAGAAPGGRQLTSIVGAGYKSSGTKTGGATVAPRGQFDPLNDGVAGPAPPLESKGADSPEDVARQMEKVVNKLIEDSAMANMRGEKRVALEKAKEAAHKERALCRHRENNGMADQINIDLTYSALFNLANQYHASQMYTEALNSYTQIVKNKQYAQSGRLRVNMGNIYYEQKDFKNAVKMYRMALDQIPHTGKEIRLKIMRNIGNAFIREGKYGDAIDYFEAIMETTPDFQSAFNLLVAHYQCGDTEKLKTVFSKLLNIQSDFEELDDEPLLNQDDSILTKPDALKEATKEKTKQVKRYVLMASKLVAPVIEGGDPIAGYEWVIDVLKSSPYHLIAAEMEIAKAIAHMKNRDFETAISGLKEFEKKDHALLAVAATNLSFVYFIQNDLPDAERYATLATETDRYNAQALCNKGNVAFAKKDYDTAKELYLEAISCEADCVEAIFNLGLVNIKQSNVAQALKAFEKCQQILPNTQEVLYQIANCYDLMKDSRHSTKWFSHLIARTPTDPRVLHRLAQIYDGLDDEGQAFHYHLESYRYYPTNMDVIAWLGGYFVKNEMYEKALQYFERASQIQPKVPNWTLMYASCLRRIGRFEEAFRAYEALHNQFPTNVECLKYLVQLCKNVNLGYADKADVYATKLAKLERMRAQTSKLKADMSSEERSGASRGGDHSSSGHAPSSGGKSKGKKQDLGHFEGSHIRDDELADGPRKKAHAGHKADDDWGTGDLGDDLLPM